MSEVESTSEDETFSCYAADMCADQSPDASSRRLRRDAELNRRRILSSARSVFSAHGLSATIEDVAQHAGVGVGTVYRRFPNKQRLVEAVWAERLEEIIELAHRALAELDPWQGFESLCWHAAEQYASDRALWEMMLCSDADGLDEAREKLYPLYEQIVTRAHQSGQLRDDFTASELPLLQLMISTVAEYTNAVAPQAWRRYLELILDSLGMRGERTPLLTPALDQNAIEEVERQWKTAYIPSRASSRRVGG